MGNAPWLKLQFADAVLSTSAPFTYELLPLGEALQGIETWKQL